MLFLSLYQARHPSSGLLVKVLRPDRRFVLSFFLKVFAFLQRLMNSIFLVLCRSIHLWCITVGNWLVSNLDLLTVATIKGVAPLLTNCMRMLR